MFSIPTDWCEMQISQQTDIQLTDRCRKEVFSHLLTSFHFRQTWKLETSIVLIKPDSEEELEKENFRKGPSSRNVLMWEKYFQIHKFVQQKPAHEKNIKNVPKYLKRYSYD